MATQPHEETAAYETDYESEASPGNSHAPLIDEDEPGRPRSRKIIWLAAIISLIWIGICSATVWQIGQSSDLSLIALTEWAAVGAGIFAPLTAVWLAALVILRADPGRSRRSLAEIEAAERRFDAASDLIAERLARVDTMLEAVSVRVDEAGARMSEFGSSFEATTGRAAETGRSLSAALSEDRERLEGAISHLAERTETTHRRLAEMEDALPRFAETCEQAGRSLAEHTQEAETRMAGVRRLLDELADVESRAAETALGRARESEALLVHIDQTSHDVERLMQERRGELDDAVAAALGRTEETLGSIRVQLDENVDRSLEKANATLEAVRTAVDAQAETLRAAASHAEAVLSEGGRGAVDHLARTLEDLGGRLGEFAARAESEDERLSGRFGDLQGRLADTGDRLDELRRKGDDAAAAAEGSMTRASEQARGLAEPLEQLDARMGALAGTVGEAHELLGSVRNRLDDELAPAAGARRMELEELRSLVDLLTSELGGLEARTEALAEPTRTLRREIGEGVNAIDDSATRMGEATERLSKELSEAEALLGAVRIQSEDTVLEASGKLIEALGRVREVADQAARSVRETLDGVVTDAVASLETASGEAVGRAVAKPVEESIGRIETASTRSAEAAQAAADRLSRSLVSVAETAAAVEARVAEANEHLETAQKRDLGEQSNLLMEALNSHSIDITKALSTDVTEDAWQTYLAGDRSVFTRRASRLVAGGDAKRIQKLFEDEPEFREAVRHYIHDYEAMLRRVMQDRQGNALSVALISSDAGRLYVALAQATDRLRRE